MKFVFLFCMTLLLAACSLDLTLTGGKGREDSGSTDDGGKKAYIRKTAFDYFHRPDVYFGDALAVSPDQSFLFITAPNLPRPFPEGLSDPSLSSENGGTFIYKKVSGVWTRQQVLFVPEERIDGNIDNMLAVSNEWYAVTSLNDYTDENGTDDFSNGAVFLFKKNGSGQWAYHSKLKAPPPFRLTARNFGSAIVFAGDNKILVRAGEYDDSEGVVYSYVWNGTDWVYKQSLQGANPAQQVGFGRGLKFQNGKLFISENDHVSAATLYTYTFDTMTEQWQSAGTITSVLPSGSDCSASFDVLNDVVAWGCREAKPALTSVGAIQTFYWNGASWIHKSTVYGPNDDAFLGSPLKLGPGKLVANFMHTDYVLSLAEYNVAATGEISYAHEVFPQSGTLQDVGFGASIATAGTELFVTQWYHDDLTKLPGIVSVYNMASTDQGPGQILGIDAASARRLSPHSFFGSSLAVSSDGENIVVGAPGNPQMMDSQNEVSNLGSVHFYKKQDDTLRPTAALSFGFHNYRQANLFFGRSMTVDGNKLAVGATGGGYWGIPDQGGVALFDLTNPFQQQILLVPAGLAEDEGTGFGSALALKGDKIFVGSPKHALGLTDPYGRVSLHEVDYSAWLFGDTVLQRFDAGAFKSVGMKFGAALALSGSSLLAVGAPEASQTPDAQVKSQAGGVWIYSYDGAATVSLQAMIFADRIYAANGTLQGQGGAEAWTALSGFGSVVLWADSYLLVGSPGQGAGVVYIYKFNSVAGKYQTVQVLKMTDVPGVMSQSQALFGSALAYKDGVLVVGAPGASLNSESANSLSNAGAVYLYQLKNGLYQGAAVVTPSGTDRSAESKFGSSVALGGSTLYVGSPGHTLNDEGADALDEAGAIFTIDLPAVIQP